MSINAMSSHSYAACGCEACLTPVTILREKEHHNDDALDKFESVTVGYVGGRYRTFSRLASRAASLRRAFNFSPSESYRITESHPEVLLFRKGIRDLNRTLPPSHPGFQEQLYPYPCCEHCDHCRRVSREFRVNRVFRRNTVFIRMLRELGEDAAMLTLTAPNIAPRPEHRDSFESPELRSEHRETFLNERLERRLASVIENYYRNEELLPHPSTIPKSESVSREISVRELERTDVHPAAAAAQPKAFYNRLEQRGIVTFTDSDGEVHHPSEHEIVDGPALRLTYIRALVNEEALEQEAIDLEQEASAAGMSKELWHRIDRNKERRRYLPVARRRLKELLKQDIIDTPGFEQSAQDAWVLECWQRGWLQAVVGPGRNERKKDIPFVYIPRVKRGRGWTYCAQERDGVTVPYLNLRWHRRHGELVPPDIKPFRPPRCLVVKHFQNLRKRIAHAGLYGDGRLSYVGVDECGASNEHFHLHLLINLPAASPAERRRFRKELQILWHEQSGNLYWGKHDARGESIDFCRRLQDDAKSARYVSNYLSKSGTTGRCWTSQGMNLNRALLEDDVIGVNPQFAHREVTFGRNDRGIPCYISRLSNQEVETALHTEWVGVNFEERRIGFKPVKSHELVSSPARSVHSAAALLSSEEIVPSAYWVPASVWQDAHRAGASCQVSETLDEALSSWSDTLEEVFNLPP